MNLKDIAHISGKSGLHKILKPTRSGVIVESLDAKKTKQVVGTQNRVSVLKEISIYTTSKDGSEPLEKILGLIFDKYGATIPVTPDSSSAEQGNFLKSVLPDYDSDRVYNSDIKRLITWYELIQKFAPELFEKEEEPVVETEVAKETKADKTEKEEKTEEKPVKKAKKELESEKKTTEELPTKKAKKEKITEVTDLEEKPKTKKKKAE